MSAPSLTYNQTIHGICDFIEVAIHTILYVRQIYPADLFIRRKKYDTPVFQSRHPALNEYISGAIKAVAEQLRTGNLEKVVVVIKNREQVALERFIFAVENMIQIEAYDKGQTVEDALDASALGHYFRGFLVKLNMIEATLGQMYLDEDVSFGITIELKPETVPTTTSKNQPPWIPAFTQHTTAGTSDESQLHLIRAVNTGIINMSLAVQETEEKLQREREARERLLLSLKKPPAPSTEAEHEPTPTPPVSSILAADVLGANLADDFVRSVHEPQEDFEEAEGEPDS
ncbi:HORMA domain-containing protein [Mycena kentingensis (nom. inval.)]|nr:HORMA domain-containing protein [Mycena kentingensis (nom. inval.)]